MLKLFEPYFSSLIKGVKTMSYIQVELSANLLRQLLAKDQLSLSEVHGLNKPSNNALKKILLDSLAIHNSDES